MSDELILPRGKMMERWICTAIYASWGHGVYTVKLPDRSMAPWFGQKGVFYESRLLMSLVSGILVN
jgi:hypothetical protein